MSEPITQYVSQRRAGGFTFVELLVALVVVSALAGISAFNTRSYQLKAEYAALQTTTRHLMDGQDFCFLQNNEFYPQTGIISIERGIQMDIPELAYNFPQGHKHRYLIYGLNRNIGTWTYNYYYLIVYSDFDFNKNGHNDIFIATTFLRNGKPIYNRKFYRLN